MKPPINIFQPVMKRRGGRRCGDFDSTLLVYFFSHLLSHSHFSYVLKRENLPSTSQIAIIRWANVVIWLAVFLVRCCQMTLARFYFDYRADLIGNGWLEIDRMPLAQQSLHKPT